MLINRLTTILLSLLSITLSYGRIIHGDLAIFPSIFNEIQDADTEHGLRLDHSARYPRASTKSSYSIFVYKAEDHNFTNIPEDLDDIANYGSFGVCTEEMASKESCNFGEFNIEFTDTAVKNRTLARVFQVLNKGIYKSWEYVPVEGYGVFSYLCYVPDHLRPDRWKISKYSKIEESNVYQVYIAYYAEYSLLIIEVDLMLVIYFRKLRNDSRSDLQKEFSIYKPYQYIFNILLVSFIINCYYVYILKTVHLKDPDRFERSALNPVAKGYSKGEHEAQRYRNYNSILFTRSLKDFLTHLIIYQFLNLDKPGFKINFKKHKLTALAFIVLLITAVMLPYVLFIYTYSFGFSIDPVYTNETKLQEKLFTASSIIFGGVWIVLYLTSQESQRTIEDCPAGNYARMFKLTRIYIITGAGILKCITLFLVDVLYPLAFEFFFKLSDQYFLHFQFLSKFPLLPKIALFILKCLLCAIAKFRIFSSTILLLIPMYVWWSYEETVTSHELALL